MPNTSSRATTSAQPEPLLEAARRLNVTHHKCRYAGGDLRNIQAKKAAGRATIVAAWGYCGATEHGSCAANTLIDTPSQLLALLPAL